MRDSASAYEVRFYNGRRRLVYAETCATEREARAAASDRRPSVARFVEIVEMGSGDRLGVDGVRDGQA